MHRFEALKPEHEVDGSTCGDPRYDRWLHESAASAVRAGTSAVTVLVRDGGVGEARVVGYFALCATAIAREEMPNRARAGGLTPIPGYLLTKLALHHDYRGDRVGMWGTQLLVGAFRQVAGASRLVGARLLVVDPGDPALVPWYEGHGFLPTASPPRLYLKVSTIEQQLQCYDA